MSKKQELTFIKVARAVAIFFVVMLHPIDRLADEANLDTVAISTFICFAVPLFFLVSGYLIGWKYQDRKEPFDASRFLRSKALYYQLILSKRRVEINAVSFKRKSFDLPESVL